MDICINMWVADATKMTSHVRNKKILRNADDFREILRKNINQDSAWKSMKKQGLEVNG